MFYAYVAKSLKHDFYYKGHCKDREKRLHQHNSGMTKSLRKYIPLEMVYFEEFDTLDGAIQREKFLKTAAGRRFLKEKLKGLAP